MKNMVIKIIIYALVVITSICLIEAFEPSVSTSMCLKQLNGGEIESGAFRLYNNIKNVSFASYLVLAAIVFGNDIKYATRKLIYLVKGEKDEN